MEETKKWYQSKTILASMVTAIIIVISFFDQGTSEKIAEEQTAITETVLSGVALVTTAIAIYGRITAKDKIKDD